MIIKTKFKNLFVVNGKKFIDKRGYFRELLIEKKVKNKFPFIVTSFSKKNVLRGLHIQLKNSQGKYISVLKGSIFDVAVDLRKKSKTYGKKYSIILSENNCRSLFIPAGFAHGFCGLDKENIVFYGCTNYWSKKDEVGILWNDKTLNIKWPVRNPIISKKDKVNLNLKDYNRTME